MKTLLHITQAEQWEQAKKNGSYRADSLDTEGFIHCSEANQVVKVANWLFRNQKGLLLLFIDAEKVKAEIRYDLVETGELFPHIYGELNVDAVFKVIEFEPGEDGLFTLSLDFE